MSYCDCLIGQTCIQAILDTSVQHYPFIHLLSIIHVIGTMRDALEMK